MKRSVKKRLLKKKIRNAEKKIRKANRIITKYTLKLDKYKNNNNLLSLQSSSSTYTTLQTTAEFISPISGSWKNVEDYYDTDFNSVVVSSNGQSVLAIKIVFKEEMYYVDKIIYSTDSGVTFKDINKDAHFCCFCSVDETEKILLFDSALSDCIMTDKLYTSIDGCVTFKESMIPSNITAVACSNTGKNIVIAYYKYDDEDDETGVYDFNGYLSVSEDYGENWKEIKTTNPINPIYTLSLSGDGNVILAGEKGKRSFKGFANAYNGLHLSTDFGKTWTSPKSDINTAWNLVTCSSDGKYLAATTKADYSNINCVYISPDTGQNWSKVTNYDIEYSYSIVSGLQLKDKYFVLTIKDNNFIFFSEDFGKTWIKNDNENSTIKFTYGISCSDDCSVMGSIGDTQQRLYITIPKP